MIDQGLNPRSRFKCSHASASESLFRILCVDDDPTFRTMLKISLESCGIEVITASHGVDALMQFKAFDGQFNSVVTDHDMPSMNGLTFVASLRDRGYAGRIVIMSGRLGTDDLEQYVNHKISGFFHKPFEVGLLAAMLLRCE